MNKCRIQGTRFSFGATAAIITNLGLIAGLRTGEHPRLSIIAGMLLIALADNISDSVGIHIYQESEYTVDNRKGVWFSTFTNFITRLLVSLTFIFMVIFLPINLAAVCSIVWGLFLLAAMSYIIARDRGINPYLAIFEHASIAVAVIILSNFLGKLVINKLHL